MTYGSNLPPLTASYSGFVNGDSAASLSTPPTLSTVSDSSHVGTYDITVSGAVDPNYSITYVSGKLHITQATLTITADDQSMTYGGPLPTLSASYSGLVNGDTAASLTTSPGLSTTATAASHVGGYVITVSGAFDPDYDIIYANGTLTINRAALTIKADNQSMTYGGTLPTLTATFTGLVNADTVATFNNTPNVAPSLSTTATATSHAGGYTITVGGAQDNDYQITFVNGTLTIKPAALIIAADNQVMTYGGTLPTLTATFTGLVNGDTPATFNVARNAAPILNTVPATSHAGQYAITVGGAQDNDYTIRYVNGILTINPAALTITADNQSMTYGSGLPAFTASYTGLVNGDTAGTFSAAPNTAPTFSPVPANSHVGSYAIIVGGAADGDYNISYANGRLTINPATLMITANNQSMTYGGPLPTLTPGYTGLVNGDTAASFATPPSLSTTATASSHVGSYAITVGGAVDGDYTISYANGSLTIVPAALTISADNKSMVYGGTLPSLTATFTGLVNGDTPASLTAQPGLSTTATARSHAGSYAIAISGASDPDYAINNVNGTLTITPAALTITADNESMIYGSALPTLNASYSGFVNGDSAASLTTPPSLSTGATASSPVGTYAILANGAGSSDYAISFVNGILTITPAATTTALASSADPSANGQTVTLTATVSLVPVGAGQSTGTVTFQDGSTVLGTGTVGANGTATITTSALNVGTHLITAVYSGDTNATASSSTVFSQMVGTRNEQFVAQVYLDLLKRPVDAGGLATWTGALASGVSRTQVVLAIEASKEYDTNLVESFYQQYLLRAGDAAGVNGWVAYLEAGGAVSQLRDFFIGSQEYFLTRGGGTNAGFLSALYHDAFNRNVDPSGLNGWGLILSQGQLSRADVAVAIFSSPEFYQDLVNGFYMQCLRRPADQGGLNTFVNLLQAGTTEQNIIAYLMGSDEYFARA
jgi:MBG domain (YGX type)/Bacterial Ig-like domain (group 3)/Domain of unknown function (DUF4214)